MQCHEEAPGVCLQDTLKTSLCAPRLFPTADGPAGSYPASPLWRYLIKNTFQYVGNDQGACHDQYEVGANVEPFMAVVVG